MLNFEFRCQGQAFINFENSVTKRVNRDGISLTQSTNKYQYLSSHNTEIAFELYINVIMLAKTAKPINYTIITVSFKFMETPFLDC